MSIHYTLNVIRTEGIQWRPSHFQNKIPKLYANVKLASKAELTTKPIRSLTPTWEESFTFSSSSSSNENLIIEVKHKRSINFQSDTVLGSCEVKLSDLLIKCANGNVQLDLYSVHRNSPPTPAGTIYVHLKANDPMIVATTEIDAANANVRAGGIAASERAGDSAVVAAAGLAFQVGDSEFYQTVCDLFSRLEGFVKFIGGLSQAHPYLKVAYELTFALFNGISKQFETDKALVDLVKIMIEAFGFAKEAGTLKDKTQNCAKTIDKLLQQTIECCRFIKQYTSNGFIRRMVDMSAGEKISDFKQRFGDLKNALNSNVTLHTAFVSARIYERIDALEINQRLIVLKNSLKPFDIKATNNPLCLDGTREDILSEVKVWLLSEASQNILWLHGIAGSGKSTIIATIADYCLDKSYLGAFLFFKRGEQQPEAIIPTIAYKLAEFDPSIAKHVPPEGSIAEGQIERQFEMLLRQPLAAVAEMVQGPVIIILDALDEYEYGTPETRKRLWKFLRENVPNLPNNFRFLITSRPERDMVDAFGSQCTLPRVHEIELDNASDMSRRDVRYYIDFEVRRIVADEEVEDKSLQNIIDKLGDASGNLFIWASTVVKLVSEHDDPARKLEEIAANTRFLTGINQLYESVMRNSTIPWEDSISRDRCVRVLGMILLSKVPLTAGEIDKILGLPVGGCRRTLSRLRSVIDYKSDSPVRLFHTSFFDYLTSSANIGVWFVDYPVQQSFIAARCFDVMGDLLRFNICSVTTSYECNDCNLGAGGRIEEEIPLHLSYACLFWAQHLCEAPYGPELIEGLSTFLYNHLLYWLEVISLLRKVSTAGPALLAAIKWIENNETEITAFIRDARRLINIFALPISQSVPHIYLSMLPLTANESKVSAHYLQHASSLVRMIRRGLKRQTSLLKRLEGHTGGITYVGFSPDGSLIVSGSYDGTVRIWDTERGEPVAAPFKIAIGWVCSATFTPDGTRIVIGGENGIVVFDAESECTVVGPFGDSCIRPITVSPDGKRAASASSDVVIIWDLESGKNVGEPFIGHTDDVWCVAYSRDGRYIVSGSKDRSVRIWDVENRRLAKKLFLGHTDVVNSVNFSPDGKYVVSGADDHTVRIWDVKKGEVDYSPLIGHEYDVLSAAYSSDGTRIVSGSTDNIAIVWNSKNGQLISGPFKNYTGSSIIASKSPHDGVRVAISPDGTRIALGTFDNTLRILDAESGKIDSAPELIHDIEAVRFSSDGSCIISDGGTIWCIDDGKVVSEGGEKEQRTLEITNGMQFSFKGTFIWDPLTGDANLQHRRFSTRYCIAISPNEKIFAFSSLGSIRVWDKERDVLICGPFDGQSGPGGIDSLIFSPDGRHIASGSDSVRIWDVETGKLLFGPFSELTGDLYSKIAYSPDGRYIASGYLAGGIKIWDLGTGDLKVLETNQPGAIMSISYSPDGSHIVSSFFPNKEIRVWSTAASEATDHDQLLASSNKDTSAWTLDREGWIRGAHDELLLWVPPDLRPTLIVYPNITIINCEFSTKLDFTGSAHGEHWYECFHPIV